MGASMCGHLLDAGYPVHVFNRSRERAEALVERGARWCDTPARGGARRRGRLHDRGPSRRRVARWSSATSGALAAMPAGSAADRHDDERAVARPRDVRRCRRARCERDRRARVRRRCRRPRRDARDHGGGSREAFERVLPLLEMLGRKIVLRGRPRRRPAHEDGQPDRDRVGDDRRLRGASLRRTAPDSTSSWRSTRSPAAPPDRGR